MSKQLVEVRDSFSKFMNDSARLNASSREIAQAFLASRRSTIPPDVLDEVTISGFVHMMGGLRKRRPHVDGSNPIRDLFAGFDIDPIVVVRVSESDGGTVDRNKDVGSLTLPEALDYLAQHSKQRAANTKLAREWRRLIGRVKPYMKREGMTLAEGMKLSEAAAARKKG